MDHLSPAEAEYSPDVPGRQSESSSFEVGADEVSELPGHSRLGGFQPGLSIFQAGLSFLQFGDVVLQSLQALVDQLEILVGGLDEGGEAFF